MADSINRPTVSDSAATMQPLSRRSSTKSQVRRRSSAMSASLVPQTYTPEQFLAWGWVLHSDGSFWPSADGNSFIPPDLQPLFGYDPGQDDQFSLLLGDEGINLGFDVQPLVAMPGGVQTQQFWNDPEQLAINAAPTDYSEALRQYVDLETIWAPAPAPYYNLHPQGVLGEVVQNHADESQSHDEETYTPEPTNSSPPPSQQRKRPRAESDAEGDDPNTHYKKARTRSGTNTPSTSRSHSGTHTSSASRSSASGATSYSDDSEPEDEDDNKHLQKTRRTRNRTSVFRKVEYEKPQRMKDRDWVRINGTTKGKTTRTAKINKGAPPYDDIPHPVGNWKGTKYEHKYTAQGEFKKKVMSAEQIKEFILEYPEDKKKGSRLTLYIQRNPTDSARRYFTESMAKCRFEECPTYENGHNGTIVHGHYRVAFDEKHHKHGQNADPFLTAGYVHLYCMERFLDFAEICEKAHVKVDDRHLDKEPRNKFAGTLTGHPEVNIAKEFLQKVRKGRKGLRKLPQFVSYPRLKDKDEEETIRAGKTPYHEHTLAYNMHLIKEDSRPNAQKKQFADRGSKPTHINVHFGDLEMLMAGHRSKKASKKSKSKKRKSRHDEDEVDSEEETSPAPRPRKKARLRKVKKHTATYDDSEDDGEHEIDDDHRFADDDESDNHRESQPLALDKPHRQSPRNQNRKRPNYTDEEPAVEPYRQQILEEIRKLEVRLEAKSGAIQQQAPSSRVQRLAAHEQRMYDRVLHYAEPEEDNAAYTPHHQAPPEPQEVVTAPPDLGWQATTRPASRTGSAYSTTSIGAFIDPDLETYDFADLDAEFRLERLRSRVSISKSALKAPGPSRRTSGESARRVSIGKTTMREFYQTQSPHAVSTHGTRTSLRLQNKVKHGRVSKRK